MIKPLLSEVPEKAYFKPEEVGKLFGVTRSTVYRWIDEGQINAVKIAGHTVRIHRDAILEAAQEVE